MSPRTARIVGIFLVALSLAALVVSIYSGYRWRQYARCQAGVNEALVERTRILTEVTAGERVAERRAFDALGDALGDPSLLKPRDQQTAADRARVLTLFKEYLDARKVLSSERARADTARAEHPVPPPPSTVC